MKIWEIGIRFMDNKTINYAKEKYLKIKRGCINQVQTTLEQNGIFGKILYVSDSIINSLYGDIIKDQITKVGCLKEEIIDFNTISYAMQIAERIIATDIKCIVGIGGGKVLDVCKYAAYISKTPFLSIPTTAANDGLVSPIAVLKRQDGLPKSLGCAMPSMILIDIDIIANSPEQFIRAGIGDTVSNYMALLDWDLACKCGKDNMNGYAYLMSRSSLDALLKTQYESICPEFVEVLVNALVLSGIAMDFAGSSRPVSGSEHLFSHALDYYGKTPNLHGIQVALGTVAVLKLIGEDYNIPLNYLKKFNVDINPIHLGIDEKTFVFCMQNATSMRTGRYTYLNEIDLDTVKLKKIYGELLEET